MSFEIGWFSDGEDSEARDRLAAVQNAIDSKKLDAEISFVFCTHDPGEGKEPNLFLRLVDSIGIPFVSVSHQKFVSESGTAKGSTDKISDRGIEYDRRVMVALEQFQPQICVLAGYGPLTGPELCQKFNMLNLQPAAPGGPTGTWQEVIWQLIDSDAKETGVVMRVMTPEPDKVPVAAVSTFQIRGRAFDPLWKLVKGKPITQIKREQGERNSLFIKIREQGLAREYPLIIATIGAFSEGKMKITPDKQVVDGDGKPVSGFDFTDEIERQLKKPEQR